MGSPSGEIVSYVSLSLVENYCIVSATVIVVYDCICSFVEEVGMVWGTKIDTTTLLLHTNRWLIFIWAIFNILLAFPGAIIQLCMYAVWAAFSGIRIYALTKGNWAITCVVVLLSIVPMGTNMFNDYAGNDWQIISLPAMGTFCTEVPKASEATENLLAISTRISVLVADTIVLVVTWSRTLVLARMAQRQNVWNPLLNLLLRDGTLYFLALLSLNALSIAGWISDVFTVASTFSIPLSSIIISHFLLNLRKITNVSTSSRGSSSGTQDEDLDQLCSCVSTPVLSSFLGNMGELLDYDADGDIDVMWEGVDDVHHGAEDVGVEHHCARDSSNKRIIPTECSSSREQAQRIEYIRAAVTVNRPGL